MSRLIRFSIVGIAGFALDAFVLLVFIELVSINPFVARIPSFLFAATLTWWLNRSWTFRDNPDLPLLRQWLKYLLAMKAGAAVNLLVYATALVTSDSIYLYPVVGVALGSLAGLTVNYLLASRLVFATPASLAASTTGRAGLNGNEYWMLAAAMPMLFGLWSLLRGQDRNWDLLNYHLYVPFAWLEGRHGIDLAAAQMQSYFPPLIDLPYYLLIQSLPGPAVAFLMGLIHGLVFIPLFAVCRRFAPPRTAICLSLIGCLGSAWLSGLGTTMGDNLAAIGIVLSIVLLLPVLEPESAGRAGKWWPRLLGSGLVLGLFVGLKVTNVIFVAALLAAFLCFCPGDPKRRLYFGLMIGLGALFGMIATSGYWFLYLWLEFGNPLFPQFNQWFGAPLASSTGIVDKARLPDSLGQALLWPIKLLTEPDRFSEVGQRTIVWLVLILVSAGLAIQRILAGRQAEPPSRARPAEHFLLLFLLLGFIAWIFTFSIYRYLVGLELLAPLAIWIAVNRAMPGPWSHRLSGALLGSVLLVGLVGSESWGHSRLAWSSVEVETPVLEHPEQHVLVLVGDQPQSWRLPWWPSEVAFIGLANNFPESEEFRHEVRNRLQARPGPHLAMVPATRRRGDDRLNRVNQWLAVRQIAAQGRLCQWLATLASQRDLGLVMSASESEPPESLICQFEPAETTDATHELAEQNRALALADGERLRPYGLTLDADSCEVLFSRLGDQVLPYQVCRISLAP